MRTKGQRGAAVITAMLVVALAATAAAFMMWQNHLWLRQVENLENQSQARWVARGAVDWARAILSEDNGDVDHGGERWATVLPPLSVEGGEVSGVIQDAQARVNLNNLVRNGKASQGDVVLTRRLFGVLGLEPNLVNALVDWMDADSEVTGSGGAEDMQYLSRNPPYRAANRPLSEVGELYRVQGFDRKVVERLLPFVAALPAGTTVNVNTAPPEVLAALAGLSLAEGKAIAERRGKGYFKNREAFRKALPENAGARDEDYNVNSRFFLATARAGFGRAQDGFLALLERPGDGKIRILWLKQLGEP